MLIIPLRDWLKICLCFPLRSFDNRSLDLPLGYCFFWNVRRKCNIRKNWLLFHHVLFTDDKISSAQREMNHFIRGINPCTCGRIGTLDYIMPVHLNREYRLFASFGLDCQFQKFLHFDKKLRGRYFISNGIFRGTVPVFLHICNISMHSGALIKRNLLNCWIFLMKICTNVIVSHITVRPS